VLPLWLKLSYSAFVAVLVPIYMRQYGWGNFLWFSDVALLLGCVAIWLEHPLLASTQAVAVVIPEAFWILEFVLRLTTGTRLLGLTDYMFDESIPRFVRALSLFHVWLPCVLVWVVWRLGYDRRAFLIQTGLGMIVLVLSYLLTSPEDNVNWVHRWGSIRGLPAFLLSTIVFPFLFYLPAHLALGAIARGGVVR
jgi:hypothetical protein